MQPQPREARPFLGSFTVRLFLVLSSVIVPSEGSGIGAVIPLPFGGQLVEQGRGAELLGDQTLFGKEQLPGGARAFRLT